jgi:hypothetical protein
MVMDDERCAECAVHVECVVCGQTGPLGENLSMFCMCQAYCHDCVEYVGADCRVCAIRGPYVMCGRKVQLLDADDNAAIRV